MLRDGAMVVFGLGLGCTGKVPPVSDDSAAASGAGTAGDSEDSEDSTANPCDVTADAGAEGWSPVWLADHPELAVSGGSVSLDIDGLPLIMAQPSEGCFVALSRICTHEGCAVEFRDGRFICPCHGAAFSIDGSVQAGPTPIPLLAYPAGEVDGVVWVQTR